MNRKWLLAAGVVLLAGGAIVFYLTRGRTKKPEHARREVRGHEVFPAIKSMLEAPPGATPCESAFIAFTAEHERAKELGRVSVFVRIAPRAEFLAGCGKLTPAQQQCLVPTYRMRHADECIAIKPPREALTPFVEVIDVEQQEDEPKLPGDPGKQRGGPGNPG